MDDGNANGSGATRASFGWLLTMSSILLLALLPFSAYVVSVPFLQQQWHINNAQSGLIFSSYLIGYAISSLFIVPLTDRYSARSVFLLGLLVLVSGNLLFPIAAKGIWTASAIRAITGAGHVAAYVPAIRLISQKFAGKRRGTAVGLFVGAGYAGTTLSYAATGLLIARFSSWQQAYLTVSLTAVMGIGLALLLVLRSLPVDQTSPATPERGRLDMKILKERAVALCTTGYALHTAELYLARLWFPLLLTASFIQSGMELTQAATQAGTWSGLMFMTGIVGVFTGGYFSDRIGRTASAASIFACSGLCSFTVGWLISLPPLLVGLGFVYGLMTAADSAIYSTAIIEVAPPDRIGSAQAVQSFVGFSIGAVAPIVVGAILDTSGSSWQWIAAFSTNGALAIFGVLALLWLRRLPGAVAMAGGRR